MSVVIEYENLVYKIDRCDSLNLDICIRQDVGGKNKNGKEIKHEWRRIAYSQTIPGAVQTIVNDILSEQIGKASCNKKKELKSIVAETDKLYKKLVENISLSVESQLQ